ncbi:hypothetical protein BT69DRAFT_1285954 [Atractiella rhizophila]|nr:hypothetical protein BT69DRAFT_1285954 [Atractiella rhizophila]
MAQELTLQEVIDAQDALETEAREIFGFDTTVCSYLEGSVKQSLWSCKTCSRAKPYSSASSLECDGVGVCGACAVSCHASHELVELFFRRNFSCDCGTTRMDQACQLSKRKNERAAEDNKYDHCFRGEFCRCGKPYNPETEEDEMIQCYICEDWFHSSCLPPLDPEAYDALICGACVERTPLLLRWAGAPRSGVLLVNEGTEELYGEVEGEPSTTATSLKRPADDEEVPEEEVVKKRRLSPTLSSTISSITETDSSRSLHFPSTAASDIDARSLAPTSPGTSVTFASSSVAVGSIMSAETDAEERCIAPPMTDGGSVMYKLVKEKGGNVDAFLQEDWRTRWCRCSNCLKQFVGLEFLLKEEEVWEPAEDKDAHKSLLELGSEALSRLPRDKTLDGLRAFNGMRDRLMVYLRPLAEKGETVTDDHVERFFALEKERSKKRL